MFDSSLVCTPRRCVSFEFLAVREREELFVQNLQTGVREREIERGGEGASKPKRDRERGRERECFFLPLATVGSGRLQPVVFS